MLGQGGLPYRGAMIRRSVLAFLAVALLTPAVHAAPLPRVRLDTAFGPIVVELDTRRAPITAGNFLAYVDEGRFSDATFYRAARAKDGTERGLIQGGIRQRVVRARAPIAHEPTSRTGLRHVDGTLSMARNAPGSAMGDFFVTLGAAPSLDAKGAYVGYAAFGRVVSGMDVVRRILKMPTYPGGYSKTTMGQTIRDPVRILRARRVR